MEILQQRDATSASAGEVSIWPNPMWILLQTLSRAF